jgi:hypothetical protein
MRQGRSDITALFGHMHSSQTTQTTRKRRTPPYDDVADPCVVLLHAELLIHVRVNLAHTMSSWTKMSFGFRKVGMYTSCYLQLLNQVGFGILSVHIIMIIFDICSDGLLFLVK